MDKKSNDKPEQNILREEAYKRMPLYLFVICIVSIGILITLVKVNKNLEIIVAHIGGIDVIEKDDQYDSIVEIFKEEEKEKGDILSYYDEISSESNTGKNDTSTSITETTSNSSSDNSTMEIKYVINTDSNKIHYSDCSFADRTKEENKETVNLTKDELQNYLNNGYTFCKTCGGK